jgi:anti-sigma factor RsiW
MSCERTDTVLHGYFDNELDALGAAEFERHLQECSDCVAELDALKALRSSINIPRFYQKMPDAFRKKVLADLNVKTRAQTPVPISSPRRNVQWLAIAAALILLAYTGWKILPLQRDNDNALLASEVVDAHLRSLQPGHLTDVISTDQHTVKPWFDGKLDFAPPVRDFAEQGYPLQGGRLDVVENRAVAALVYGRRKHLVNVFIWPAAGKDASPRSGSLNGYNWIDWRKQGMEFYAVSDAAPADLEQLQKLFAQ